MIKRLFSLIIISIVVIIIAARSFFYHSPSTKSTDSTTQQTPQEDWSKIASEFADQEVKKNWTENDLDYRKTQAWIEAGLNYYDANFASWLEETHRDPNWLKWCDEADVPDLRRQYYLFVEEILDDTQDILQKKDFTEFPQKSVEKQLEKAKKELESPLIFPPNLWNKPDEETPTIIPPRPPSSFRTNQDLTEEELRWVFYQIKEDYELAHPVPVPATPPSVFRFNNSNPPLKFPYGAVPLNIVSETINHYNGDPTAESQLDEIVKQCRTTRQQLVFIPINNANFNWSVLVYYTKSKQFYHYDLMGLNQTHLQKFHQQLTKRLGVSNHLNSPVISTQGKNYESGLAAVGVVRCLVNNLPLSSIDLAAERTYWKERWIKQQQGK